MRDGTGEEGGVGVGNREGWAGEEGEEGGVG